ncbi:hypothetical protein BX600DRAFT_428650 [Xylariales sp. PMI_506]|nr:hypothetical protein BX600DRAFT_428650 [Xylariales sp. PMI_506]
MPMAQYFEIKGILSQRIYGYDLFDLPISPFSPLDQNEWSSLLQSAVDLAHDINKRGYLLNDCSPRNVVVDKRSQSPFIIDLARCNFKDKMIKMWEELSESGDEDASDDFNLEAEYWERVRGTDNPGAIGSVMIGRIKREKDIVLNIQYPNIDDIIEDIKLRKPLE